MSERPNVEAETALWDSAEAYVRQAIATMGQPVREDDVAQATAKVVAAFSKVRRHPPRPIRHRRERDDELR